MRAVRGWSGIHLIRELLASINVCIWIAQYLGKNKEPIVAFRGQIRTAR